MIDDTDDQWIALDDTSDCDLATPPPSPKKDPMNSPRVLKAIADAVAKALEEKKEDKPPESVSVKPKRKVHTGL